MYLGIDLGTSAVKTVLVDHEQRVVASRSRSLTVNSPHPGYSEQDAGSGLMPPLQRWTP
jgi:xylulokinase